MVKVKYQTNTSILSYITENYCNPLSTPFPLLSMIIDIREILQKKRLINFRFKKMSNFSYPLSKKVKKNPCETSKSKPNY